MVELAGYIVGMLIGCAILAVVIGRRQRKRPAINTGRVLETFESERAGG